MAHSLLQFKNKKLEVRDASFEGLIEHLSLNVAGLEPGNATHWLTGPLNDWFKYWDAMPPGCKLLKMDDVLTSNERLSDFYSLLSSCAASARKQPGSLDWLERISTRVEGWLKEAAAEFERDAPRKC